MFVEQVSWTVPQGNEANSIGMLNNISQYMNASGGLLKALVGSVTNKKNEVTSISFWKSWENLSRFLNNDDVPVYRTSGRLAEKLQRHHYEVIWEWPEDEIKNIQNTDSWIMYDFAINDIQMEQLLDDLRHYGAQLAQVGGFKEAALWVDKSCPGHIVLATQWASARDAKQIETPEQLKKQFKIDVGQVVINVLALKAASVMATQM